MRKLFCVPQWQATAPLIPPQLDETQEMQPRHGLKRQASKRQEMKAGYRLVRGLCWIGLSWWGS